MSLFDPTADAISRSSLPPSFVNSPSAIAKWIDNVVPCVIGPQSEEVTEMVVKYLRKRLVSDANIAAALSKSVYKFSYPMSIAVQLSKFTDEVVPPMINPPPSMTARNAPSLEDVKRQIDRMDYEYERARLNHNTAQMEKLVEAALKLLEGYLKTRQGRDKNDDVRDQILRNSRNIAPIVRRVVRGGPAPGPGGRIPRQVGVHEYVLEDAEVAEAERAD